MPEAAVAFNALDANFVAIPEKVKGERGRDVRKRAYTWKDVKRVYEFDDGWYIGLVDDPEDAAQLGSIQGHCSGTHFVWTHEERIWYFFVLFDGDDSPRSTIHMKQASWIGKRHPRDDGEEVPDAVWSHLSGSYPSYDDVKRCFKEAGLEYEDGKYRPLYYDSAAYDYALERAREGASNPFQMRYGRAQIVRNKPPNVDDDVWQAYVQAAKAVEDNFKKNLGEVQVVGRRVKYAGKWLVVLSATNKSQEAVHGAPGKKIAEWLISLNRKEKK